MNVIHLMHPTNLGRVRACDTSEPYVDLSAPSQFLSTCGICTSVVAMYTEQRDEICRIFDVPREMVPLYDARTGSPVPPDPSLYGKAGLA